MQVISGRVSIAASGETVECDIGTLVTFDPGERHAVRGLEDARLLRCSRRGRQLDTTRRRKIHTLSICRKTQPANRWTGTPVRRRDVEGTLRHATLAATRCTGRATRIVP